jgi:hypothetical protein
MARNRDFRIAIRRCDLSEEAIARIRQVCVPNHTENKDQQMKKTNADLISFVIGFALLDLGISEGEQYNVSRYLGSVPVEEDGSAYFQVPAVRSLSLIAVDDAGREVKYMRTQVNVMPGEVVSCVGCGKQVRRAVRDVGH